MADNDNELSKVLKEQAKQQKEAARDLAETNREIDATTREFSSSFQKVVKGLQEVNPELAKTVAEIRKTTKDTLAGALQKRKSELVISNIELLQKKQTIEAFKEAGGDLDLIRDTFAKYGDKDFDFDTFANIEAEVKRTTDRFFEVQRQLGEQADRIGFLTQTQEENNKETDKFIKETAKFLKIDPSSSLEDIQKKLDENFQFYQDYIGEGLISKQDGDDALAAIDKNRELYKKSRILQGEASLLGEEIAELNKSGLEQQLAQAEEDQEENLRLQKDFNERVKKNLKELNNDSNPIGDFAEGLKDLTDGVIDLESVFDDVVKYTNAVGKIFGKKDLFGSVVSASQNFFASDNKLELASKMFRASIVGLGKLFTGLATGFATVIKSLAVSAGSLIKVLEKIAAGLGTAAKGLGRALIAFIPAALAFVTGLLATAAGMLVAALPYIAIAAAVIALGYAVYKAAEWIEEKTGFFSALWSGISTSFSTALGGLFDFFGGIGTFFYGLFTLDFGMMWAGLKQTFSGFWDVITSPLQGLFDFFSELFNFDILGYFKNIIKDIPVIGGLFGGGEEFDAQKDLADSSGILTRDWGMDTIDTSMAGRASDKQIQAILDTADVSPADRETLEGILADRAAIRAADEQELAYQQQATILATESAAGTSTQQPVIVTNAQSTNSSTSNVYPSAPQTRNQDRYGATVASTQFVY